jgi:hypothetical protein
MIEVIVMQLSYLLKWRCGSDPQYAWSLRGIHPDGSFYGEITWESSQGRGQVNVEGKLSQSDCSRLQEILERIDKIPHRLSSELWVGLLAEGSPQHPRIIHLYPFDCHARTDADAEFVALIDILKPYIEKFYDWGK